MVRLRLPHSFSIVLAIVGLAVIPAHATSSASYQPGTAAVASQASAKSQAIVELRRAAASLHRTADELVAAPGALIPNLRWQFSLGRMRGAIRRAHALGLDAAAKPYVAVLKRESDRVDFAHFVHRAERYGEQVAQKAHRDNPQLTPVQLGVIASNASAWHGNTTLQKNALAAARRVGKKTYEITVKPGQELDEAAYKIYRGFSIGARRTNIRYTGREGLHRLPDAKGGTNGGTIGFRRAAETSDKKSPAIDLNTPELGDIKFHFVK